MGGLTRTNFGISVAHTLDNAAIKALPTTPFTLVEAKPGKIICPLFNFIEWDFAGIYNNVDAGANIYPQIGSVGDIASSNNGPQSADLGAIAAKFAFGTFEAFGSTVAAVVNQPLVIFAVNGVLGDFTDGDALNKLRVSVWYCVADAV